MFPLLVLLSLQCGRVCNAVHTVQTLDLQVDYGWSVVLPCNGSAYQGKEGSVQWEALGEDVAILRGGELRPGNRFERRIQMPSEEKLREGDWSVVLQHTMLSDSNMYECIWQGRKTIATVWLTVAEPHIESSIVVFAGAAVDLTCYIASPRTQTPNNLQVWWTRNGSTIVSTALHEGLFSIGVEVSNVEDLSRIGLIVETKEAIHLHIGPAMMSDSGEYHCYYKTRDSEDPRSGTPQGITLTVLETNTTDIGATETFSETSSEDLQREDTVPWIRIGLIAGVLMVTVVVLCVLKVLQRI